MFDETRIIRLESEVDRLKRELESSKWVYFDEPKTHVDFDGDAYSTLSDPIRIDVTDFEVPRTAKALMVKLLCRDSASSSTSGLIVSISPNDTYVFRAVRPSGLPNDYMAENTGVCPTDGQGGFYLNCTASGSGTLDIWVQVWGYLP